MTPFRIRKDARDWFRDLRKADAGFSVDFDAFYFCFMAGVTMKRKKDANLAETAELVAYFPGRYRTRGKLLVALFLSRELQELGVTMSEKRSVHAAIRRLVSPDAANHLNEDGVREFNRYDHGGFEVLLEWFDDRPRSLATFLQAYKRHVDEVVI